MSLTTKSRLEHLARAAAQALADQSMVEEAWVQFDEDQYQVLILVDLADLGVEQEIRAVYGELMSMYPDQELDLYVTSTYRTPAEAWRSLIAPDARKILA